MDQLRVALGRDMRLSAPSMAEQYARGIADEGADVLDIGMAGTEMVYWTVGSRELDGGLMCTASHNPASYTGAKLVRRGALALSGDAGIGDLREIVSAGEPGPPAAQPGRIDTEDVAESFRAAALGYIDPDAIAPLKVVLDGGNGMAGPMVGPCSTRFPSSSSRPTGRTATSRTTSPTPCWRRTGASSSTRCARAAARSGHSLGWRRRPLLLHRRHGRVRRGRLPHRPAGQSMLSKEPGATVLYDVRASRAVKDTVERSGGTALVNRVDAFFKTRMRETGAAFGGEVWAPTTSATSTARTRAPFRRCWCWSSCRAEDEA